MVALDPMTESRGAASSIAAVLLAMASLLVAEPLHAAEPEEASAQEAEDASDADGNADHGPGGAESAPTTVVPAASPPEPAPNAPTPVAEAQRLARAGSWLLSADDALPLFSVGAATSLSTNNAVRYGHPGGFAVPAAPSALTLDYVVGARFTLGASPILESTIGSDARGAIHILGGALRVGHILPLGEHLALWPHVGIAYVARRQPDGYVDERHRTDLVADLRLAWTPNGRWALTVGPSLSAPLDVDQTIARDRMLRDCAGRGCLPTIVPEPNPNVRLALSAGLTVRLDAEPEQGPRAGRDRRPVRFLLGAERLVPIVRYRVENGPDGDDQLDLGLADTTSRFPSMPRVAFDVVVQEWLTLGAAANVGYVRTGSASGLLYPERWSDSFVTGVSPRVGGFLPATEWLAFWPRVGMTWVNSTGRESSRHIGADVDAFLVFLPVEGIGLVVGPSLALPLVSESEETRRASTQQERYSFFSVGVSGGLVLLL